MAADPDAYLQAWAVGECVWGESVSECEAGVAEACEVLASSVFGQCHAVIPPQDYVATCRQLACHPAAVCDLIAAYSSVCRQQGICVNWRNPNVCRESVYVYMQPKVWNNISCYFWLVCMEDVLFVISCIVGTTKKLFKVTTVNKVIHINLYYRVIKENLTMWKLFKALVMGTSD